MDPVSTGNANSLLSPIVGFQNAQGTAPAQFELETAFENWTFDKDEIKSAKHYTMLIGIYRNCFAHSNVLMGKGLLPPNRWFAEFSCKTKANKDN